MAVILIVEDEVLVRESAVTMLEDLGYDVLAASGVEEALSQLRSPQLIDALFTDVGLNAAVFGGCELAHHAVALRPDFPVLYTTGKLPTDDLKARFVPGAHFLSKPYSQLDLRGAVEDLFAVHV